MGTRELSARHYLAGARLGGPLSRLKRSRAEPDRWDMGFAVPACAEAAGTELGERSLASGLGLVDGEKGRGHRTTTSRVEWGVEMADENTEEQQEERQGGSEGAAGGSLAGAAKGAVAGAAAGAAVGAAVAALTGRKGQEPTSESENDETDESSGGVEDDDQSSEAEE